MGQVENMGIRTFKAGADLLKYRRVKLNGVDTVVYAGAGEAAIGITMDYASSGDYIAVRTQTQGLCLKVEAGATITGAAALYGGADGVVSSSSSGTQIGVSLENDVTSGAIFEELLRQL